MKHLVVIAALLLVSVTGAQAADLKKQYSDAELVALVKSEGFTDVTVEEEGTVSFEYEGRQVQLIRYDDGDLQLYHYLTGYEISFKDINTWNLEKRLSRAYIDEDRDPVIEADLLMNAGATEKQITEFLEVFKLSMDEFKKFIRQNDQS